jgi:hypothetical protein
MDTVAETAAAGEGAVPTDRSAVGVEDAVSVGDAVGVDDAVAVVEDAARADSPPYDTNIAAANSEAAIEPAILPISSSKAPASQ